MKFAKICIFKVENGVGRKQGNPWDPEGVERVYPCLRPPIFDREIGNLREFHFINRLT